MLIKGGTLITPFSKKQNTDIFVKDGIISDIGAIGSGDDIFDATGCYVCPGLVDIHTHGGGGGDYMDGSEEAFDRALKFQSESGVTSILASSVTAPVNQIETMLSISRKYMSRTDLPCRVLGVHLEGPYISYAKKGAQPAQYLRVPSKDSYDFILRNKDIVKNVTIATELDGAVDMVKELRKNGIVVSCGHDDGRSDTIIACIEAGVTNCTHWYCAMSTASMVDGVRSVGMMETALIDPRLTIELIADNHHIIPELARLAYQNKGALGICLVSDCLRAGGMEAGETLYNLGSCNDPNSQRFRVCDGVARMEDGTHYAGSIQPISRMIKNLVYDARVPLEDAVCAASYTPSRIIGMDDQIGSVEIGKKADFCIMDNELNVVATILNGKTVYAKN